MNKKILIASIFATLMLLVPMTSVIGVSDVEDDCGCQVVNRYDLFRVKLLLVRLEVYINIILLRFGYIPEVAEKCQEILDVINSNRQLDYPIICDMLEPIWNKFQDIVDICFNLRDKYEDNPIIYYIIELIILPPLLAIGTIILIPAVFFDCDWVPEP